MRWCQNPISRTALDDLVSRFEAASGSAITDLPFLLGGPSQIEGCIELTTLAVVRFCFRWQGVEAIIGAHPTSPTF
jgi:hypothetical protein